LGENATSAFAFRPFLGHGFPVAVTRLWSALAIVEKDHQEFYDENV